MGKNNQVPFHVLWCGSCHRHLFGPAAGCCWPGARPASPGSTAARAQICGDILILLNVKKVYFSFLNLSQPLSLLHQVNLKQYFNEVSVLNVIFMCSMSEHLRENVWGQLISASAVWRQWDGDTKPGAAPDRHQLGYGGLRRIRAE